MGTPTPLKLSIPLPSWNSREARFFRATGLLVPWKRIPTDMRGEVRKRQRDMDLREEEWEKWNGENEVKVERVMWEI